MKKEFSELVRYLDKKFARLENDISKLQKKTITIEDRVIKIEEKMATKVEMNKLLDAVDAYMKQGEDYRQELVMLSHRVDRHEKWLEEIAKKLGMRLDY